MIFVFPKFAHNQMHFTYHVFNSIFVFQCVCGGFWLAWILFYEIIYPSAICNIVPVFINHAVHTTPVFIVFIELFFCYHASPRIKPAIGSLLTVETIYLLT